MSTVTFHVGDVRDVMASMPDGSVDCLITSPPFLALRSYLPLDHPLKSKEIGSETTPAKYLDTLLALTAEWRRLLAPTGSLCVELGDTYSGSGGAGGDYSADGLRAGQPVFRANPGRSVRHHADGYTRGIPARAKQDELLKRGDGWPLAKSLVGIPAAYELSLIYGHNVISGAASPAGRWRVRNWMTWTRPNPPVGALADKFRPATSFVTVACVSDRRWFDLDAVRGDSSPNTHARTARGVESRPNDCKTSPDGNRSSLPIVHDTNGAPPLDWHDDCDDWQPLHRMPTAPYPGAHYATYPLALPRKLIEAMCPRQVCRVCREPRRRIAITPNSVGHAVGRTAWTRDSATAGLMHSGPITVNANHHTVPDVAERTTLGWTACGCDDIERVATPDEVDAGCELGIAYDSKYRPGVVLDPFAGSGTTLLAAALCGRDAIGIDLDVRNLDLTLQRLHGAALVTGDNPWTVNPDLPPAQSANSTPSLFAEGATG